MGVAFSTVPSFFLHPLSIPPSILLCLSVYLCFLSWHVFLFSVTFLYLSVFHTSLSCSFPLSLPLFSHTHIHAHTHAHTLSPNPSALIPCICFCFPNSHGTSPWVCYCRLCWTWAGLYTGLRAFASNENLVLDYSSRTLLWLRPLHPQPPRLHPTSLSGSRDGGVCLAWNSRQNKPTC